jgi:hypothetical protein
MADPTEARLDHLLDRWARVQRLDAREAEAVLHAILPPPPGPVDASSTSLPATWWSDLSAQVSAAIVLATARPASYASP